jgi:hypothetical protein
MGASSATPEMRDKEYQEKRTYFFYHGLCTFQLCCAARRWGDCFIPRIGDYDKWAIKWGYSYFEDTKDEHRKKCC